MSLEHRVVPESMEVLKNDWDISTGRRNKLKESLTGQIGQFKYQNNNCKR